MSATELIKKHLDRLKPGQIFVTRHLLYIAQRGTLDQALYRLVKNGFIVRLARGVFCQKIEGAKLPSITEIVKTKATAFGKTIATHGQSALERLTINQFKKQKIVYASNGKSSSFVVLGLRIYLEGTTMNRVNAGDSKPGLAIRALAHLGRRAVMPETVATLCDGLNKTEQKQLKKRFPPLMTGWMSDIVVHSSKPLGVT